MRFSEPDPPYRRLMGVVLGGALGLAYGLVSQWINRVLLPGVPLYQPPFGPAGNSLLFAVGGVLLGLVCAWPAGGVQGTFLASAISALILVGGNFATTRLSGNLLIAIVITGGFLILPFWGLLVPFLAALRWGVNHLEEAQRERRPLYRRLPRPLLLVLAAGLAGALSLYRPDARAALAHMDALLRAGQGASSAAALPTPLQHPDINAHFSDALTTPYTLATETRRVERFRIPRPGRNFEHHQFVVARFTDGWSLVCAFITLDEAPLCQGFEQLPP